MQTEIVKYNKEWEKLYREEAKAIKKALGKNCVAVHHIRDTAFKSDICVINGKIEMMLMAVVKNADDVSSDILHEVGYGQTFAGYKKEGDIDIILWIRNAENNNSESEFMREISLRNYMMSHTEKAKEYAEYKAKCAGETADILDVKEATENFFDELRSEIGKWTKDQNNFSFGLSMGMCLGMSVGMAIGSAMGNAAIGMTMGMSVGMCLGIAIGSVKNKK